ncbi:MAG TPA: protein phosphatase 2C domain-containing protein [Sphingomonas sp.]|nr:protein phosphatase 2C domain-containing protein [Sphingomonas sp.]
MRSTALLARWLRPSPPASFTAGRTHVGRVRTVNEDRLLECPDRGLWAVADGMGGHNAGAAAATTAIEALARLAGGSQPIARASIVRALDEANAAIYANSGSGLGAGVAAGTSGATIVVLGLDLRRATIAWAGDSRAYRIRDGAARQLTHDHSLVQEMVDAGVLSASGAERHPRANVVTRALGVAPGVQIDVATADVVPGDRLLLCSDGISRSLDARDFTTMPTNIDACADRLLANALQRDGSDNATLVLIDVAAR